MKVSSSAMSMSSVLLSWSPPSPSNTSCPPTTYIITISAGSLSLNLTVMEFNLSDVPTSKTVTGLTPGLEYSFFVLGVDSGGRVGKKSMPVSMFILDGEQLMESSVLAKCSTWLFLYTSNSAGSSSRT